MADVDPWYNAEDIVDEAIGTAVRYFPPTWLLIRRQAKEAHIEGLVAEPGSVVLLSIYHAMRHPDIHTSPASDPHSGVPDLLFGAGHRLCPFGQQGHQEVVDVLRIVARCASPYITSPMQPHLRAGTLMHLSARIHLPPQPLRLRGGS
jgi:hypothetical protein